MPKWRNGRRTSLKNWRGQPREGSTPSFGIQDLYARSPLPDGSGLLFANIPPIIRNGGEWYAKIGTEKSKGTKVFALAGSVMNTGLVEVPMGITLREIVFEVGGGIPAFIPCHIRLSSLAFVNQA